MIFVCIANEIRFGAGILTTSPRKIPTQAGRKATGKTTTGEKKTGRNEQLINLRLTNKDRLAKID